MVSRPAGDLAGAAAGRICQDRQPTPARGSRQLPAFEGIRAKAPLLLAMATDPIRQAKAAAEAA